MYEASTALAQPNRSRQQLWRYFTTERLLDLLRTEELFFTHLPAFSDGLEGSLTARSRERLFRWFCAHGSSPATAREDVLQYETHQAAFFANCWHMNDSESYLMWKAYADRGFAVRTTFERVQSSFDSFPGTVTGGVISYVDFERDITHLGNVFTHVTTKDLPYRDEREFRLFVWRSHPRNQAVEPGLRGLRVRVDLRMLIERVFENPITKRIPPELGVLLEEKGIERSASVISHRVAE